MSPIADSDSPRPPPSPPPAPYPGPAKIYVVPSNLVLNPKGEPISLGCNYFYATGEPVTSQPIQQSNAFFNLTQWTGSPGEPTLPPGVEAVVGLSLFSAVAKTLADSYGLNNSFLATTGTDGANSVLVPVVPGSTRGVILVFRYPATGPVQWLVATSDPEIKNTSNTSALPGG